MSKRTLDATVPAPGRERRLALVLWEGTVGGAESFTITLAERLRLLGTDVAIVFVRTPSSLAGRLERARIPYRSLGFAHGRDVALHPRLYAKGIADTEADGALLVECGFIGAALRTGGFRGAIVGVEHGALLLDLQNPHTHGSLFRKIGRITGAWTADAQVAVSDFMLEHMYQHAHGRVLTRIYNGIDTDAYRPAASATFDRKRAPVVGFVGRLVAGKGVDILLRALAHANKQLPLKLLIAGDGPERSRLAYLARTLGAPPGSSPPFEFLGAVDDVSAFWQRCDIAAAPSQALESFSMATLEAMACAKPVVATRNGAIPELVVDGVSGTLVAPNDIRALSTALVLYAQRPDLRNAHGTAARARALERFNIDDCARAYLRLFDELARRRRERARRKPARAVRSIARRYTSR